MPTLEKKPTTSIREDEGRTVTLNGFEVQVRAVTPADEDRLSRMFLRLSLETVYKRFHLPMPRVPEWALVLLTDVDHRDKESFVALVGDEIVGQAMYVREEGAWEAEVAVFVEDAWQSKGIGGLLLCGLAEEARRWGIEVFSGTVLGENRGALRFFSRMSAGSGYEIKGGLYHVRLPLRGLKPP